MATTRDYVDYLNDQIDIAPANSQEELDAAELLQQIMEQHQLDVRVQEFEAPSGGVLPYRILMVLMFLGVLLAGFYGTPAAAAGVVLVFVCGALFLLRQLGYDLLSGLGARTRSQNVIGIHRAEGPMVVKGNRPIVIVAHYDTPRESLLYKGSFARVQPLLKRAAPALVALAFVFGIFQLFGFVPVVARRVLWAIGLFVSLPLLLLGVDAIYGRFSPCTEGAVDNKSSLAAMLSVLSKVRPGEDVTSGYSSVMDEKRAVARAAAERARAKEEARERALAEAAAAAAMAEGVDYAGEDGDYSEFYDMELEEYDEFDAAEGLDELEGFEPYGDELQLVEDEPEFADELGYDDELVEEEELGAEPEFEPAAYAEPVIDPFAEQAEEPVEEVAPEAEAADEVEPAADFAGEDDELSRGWPVAEAPEEPEAFEEDASFEAVAEAPAGETGSLFTPVDTEVVDEPVDELPYEEPITAPPFIPAPFGKPFVNFELEDAEYEEITDEDVFGAEALENEEFVSDQFVDETFGSEAFEDEAFGVEPFEDEAVEDEPVESADDSDLVSGPFVPSFARVRSKTSRPTARREPLAPVVPEVEPQVVTDRYEEIVGVRHGKDVVESLRMLPNNCEVEYVEPKLISRSVRPQDEIDRAEFGVITAGPANDWEPIVHSNRDDRFDRDERMSFFDRIREFFASLRDQFFGEPIDDDSMLEADYESDYGYDEGAYDERLDASYWDDPNGDDLSDGVPIAPAIAPRQQFVEEELEEFDDFGESYDDELDAAFDDEPLDTFVSSYDDDASAPAPTPADIPILASRLAFEDEPLPTDDEIDLMDGSGLTEVVDYDLNDSEPRTIEPAPKAEGVDDPTWGKSEYQPPVRSVSRRASLFDLPDPSSRSTDPFADDSPSRSGSLRLVDDDEDPRNGRWKGGATTRAGLRDADEEFPEDFVPEDDVITDEAFEDESVAEAQDQAQVEEQQELRDAILSMGDDELIAHDIWFVALGASEQNHAGMTAFLRDNRSKIRGAFMVNLDSIGAGMLSLVTKEGLFNARKTDRRMLRMMANIADDLHISVDKVEHGWEDTDATQAMRKSVRALTIMGVENGVAALSHTSEDTAEAVDSAQVNDVAAMIAELIRRA